MRANLKNAVVISGWILEFTQVSLVTKFFPWATFVKLE